MQEIVPFDFQGNAVRVVRGEDGEPWFHANDVCSVLGFTNPRKAIADHVDADDVTKRDTIDALSRTQQVNYINESGVYALIFGSTKPEAKAFKRWVTHEVLPAIRKSGRYALFSEASIQEAIEVNARLAGLLDSCLSLYSLLGLSGEKRMMAVRKHMLEQYGVNLDEAMPGIGGKTITLTQLGAIFGKNAQEVYALLQEFGLQILENDEWVFVDPDRVLFRIARCDTEKYRFLDDSVQDGTTRKH